MFYLYNILVTLILILASPYFLFRSLFQEKFRRALPERLGFFRSPSFQRPIWVHAASVGEVFCSIPLLKRVKKEFPFSKIVLTTVTSTGNEAAKTRVPEADRVFFLPIDHPLIVRRAVKKIEPSILLIAETELWPNLLRSCGKKGIPVVLFNGRISQRSFRRYLRLKFFFQECLRDISLFLMQTEEDRNRILEMGGESQRTRTVGNLKFDQTLPPFTPETVAGIARTLGLQGTEKILVAGSTHSGEEEILVSLYKELKERAPALVLVLAPRHLERLEEVEEILRRASVAWSRKTTLFQGAGRSDRKHPEVILLDTMGELMNVYSLGTLVFIGGSLVPVGGHNPLEPLFFGKCVLFGPHMFNFLEISTRLVEDGGAIQVSGKEDLSSQLKRLLFDEAARNGVGQKGRQFLRKHQGATERMFEEIRPFLEDISDCRF
ncbi:MAG TPA: 3-deoxy-D-manno-octulosonic acid transferase [Thermodesulfobacteriota bacterium]|nr:3-deoxy-D-manno-octulosonic acid transferase [Thermodesulfobacteriota bacterium]